MRCPPAKARADELAAMTTCDILTATSGIGLLALRLARIGGTATRKVSIMAKKPLALGIVIGLVVCAGVVSGTRAAQTTGGAIAIDGDDLAGTVTGASGPEAGVWVIAETSDLPTPFARIVVTDDRGRYLVPDLPKANYRVWVRGYGLVDSPKVQTTPGKNLDLRAVSASSPAEAAHYYPAAHWLSLMEMPAKSEFPGTGDSGNGISPNMKSQGDWIRSVKSGGCTACHALGTKGTREIPAALGPFPTSVAAWDRRVKSGQAGGQMNAGLNQFGRARVLKMFADWTDQIRPERFHRRRNGRRGSSATWSSRSGTGPIPRHTCTTSSRPTAGIRASIRTGLSTERSN